MCWCDEFEFTINRGDNFMVMRKSNGIWYEISPSDLLEMISFCDSIALLEKKIVSSGEIVILKWVADKTPRKAMEDLGKRHSELDKFRMMQNERKETLGRIDRTCKEQE